MAVGRKAELGIKGLTDAVEIGRGGFAVVYRAYQPTFDRFVAVKVFNDLALDETIRETFRRECRAIGRLAGRPNILNVYQAGDTSSGKPYLLMAYLAGGSLQDRLDRDGPLPWAEVVDIGIKLARALQAVHTAGVLHRDVKPDNVLLSEDGEPELADFGIARLTDATRQTRIPRSFTPAHVAPEVLAGEAPTSAVDVYSLGSTLFALIAGRPAFLERRDDEFFVVAHRVQTVPVPDLLRPQGTPDAVWRAIAAAMAKNPIDRPPSAAAFAVVLEDSAGRLPHRDPSWIPGQPAPTAPVIPRGSAHDDRATRGRAQQAAGDQAAGDQAAGDRGGGDQAATADSGREDSDNRATVLSAAPRRLGDGPPVELPGDPVPLTVYRPTRRPRMVILALASLVLVVGGVVGWRLAMGGPAASDPRPPAAPLAVVGTALALQPVSGVLHCPQGVAVYTAIITTNGRPGLISYHWVRPDGSQGPVASARVGAGQTSVTATLSFTFSGDGTTQGRASFDIVEPAAGAVSGPAVSYQCP